MTIPFQADVDEAEDKVHLTDLKSLPVQLFPQYVESLASYVNRLAEAHCLNPSTLIVEVIAPQVNRGLARHITSRKLNTLFNLAHTLNGTGEIATNLIEALEALTLRNDLGCLTLLNWSDVLLYPKILMAINKVTEGNIASFAKKNFSEI